MNTEIRKGNKSITVAAAAFRRSSLILLLVALCIATAALAATALSGKGSFTGKATISSLGGTLRELEIDASGNVAHLGKSTIHLHTIADFSGSVPTPVPPTIGVLTAANGDTISFTLRWTVQEIAPGVFATAGPFTITGGTGRFTGATGNGDYEGVVDTNTDEVAADISGELVR